MGRDIRIISLWSGQRAESRGGMDHPHPCSLRARWEQPWGRVGVRLSHGNCEGAGPRAQAGFCKQRSSFH